MGAAVLLAACLGACGSSGGKGSVAQRGGYKVGAPYKIDGVTYTPQEEFNHVETGVASWYGPGFHGKSTANGERYDQTERTAAHRTLQMPSIVRVTNVDNGLSTVVRINDRGPFARSRVIDLSRTAAQELDIVRNGTGRVRIEQLQAESLAVKDVAIGGGGPAEQSAALAQLASGRRAPAGAGPGRGRAPAAAPPPSQAVWPTARAARRPRQRSRRPWRPTVASLASATTLQPVALCRPAPSTQAPNAAALERPAFGDFPASAGSRGPSRPPRAFRPRMPPALSLTG
jgi:rare lipoprotein A